MRAVLLALLLLPVGRLARAESAAELDKRAHQNASCVGCHPDVAVEWSRSLHREAWRDPVFQKAYAVEPVAFCRGCHAPESDPDKEPTARAKEVGIGCVTCHVNAGEVHSARASGRAEHPVKVDSTMAGPQLCARCHQFDFPPDSQQLHAEPMQDTIAEHARSSEAATPCQSCHMPYVDGPDGRHRSHAFSVLSDPSLIRSAVTVRAERVDTLTGPRVRVTLVGAKIGHAFPTGDMFRRLEVRAVAVDPHGRTLARAVPAPLLRVFGDRPRDPGGTDLTFARVELEDTRVPPPGEGERVVELVLPARAGVRRARVVYTVAYQRMSTPMARSFGVNQVLDEIIVASGELGPQKLASTSGGLRP